MKTLLSAAIALLVLTGPAWAAPKTVTLSIPGMSCSACPITVKKALMKVQVTILARRTLLVREDPAIGEAIAEAFRAEGITVLEQTRASAVSFEHDAFTLVTEQGGVRADRLVVAAGRTPNTDRLGLDTIGVKTDAGGAIVIDDHMRTSAPDVYGAGDCTAQPRPAPPPRPPAAPAAAGAGRGTRGSSVRSI